ALVRADAQALRVSDESTAVRWFPCAALPGELAFDHDTILAAALNRLRSKLEYTTLAFQLLPEVFSILELKAIYEQILGEGELDKGNFYRKIKDARLLEETGERREGRGRPTTLYRFARQRGEEQFVFRWREARGEGVSD
ncbi:MAG: NUDIX hydrolase, partial [Roseiflexaceae bacterium]|nr:NUDIX hydrolase [Roseiflexaceae bacterium]